MNVESKIPKISKPIGVRMLKFGNGFWYFMMIVSVVLFAIVLSRLELYVHNWVALGVYLSVPVVFFVVAVGMLKLVAPIQRLNLSLLCGLRGAFGIFS